MREQPVDGLRAAFHARREEMFDRFIACDAVLGKRSAIALDTVAVIRIKNSVANQADSAVPQMDEVIDRAEAISARVAADEADVRVI